MVVHSECGGERDSVTKGYLRVVLDLFASSDLFMNCWRALSRASISDISVEWSSRLPLLPPATVEEREKRSKFTHYCCG